ncbi:MAG TPA: 3-oxoadipate enol-lactonase [Candidatus Acidoferrum sp.]|nr:3-oxoadipate enol-lactonase [Candidatus Acidoferrum sp.]
MPFADLSDVCIHYSLTGLESAPVLVLSNSLGSNLSMWDLQLPSFNSRYRLLRYDTRGHGQSSAPTGPYSIELLANDVLHLLDALHIDRVHFCGLSMGGQTGIWLGIHASQRLNKLILCNTGAKIGSPESWNSRIDAVFASGMTDVSATVISRWFTPAFTSGQPEIVASTKAMLESANPPGYTASCAAVRDYDAREQLASISVPTLVIAGDQDQSTPPADGRFIASNIPGARFALLSAAHLSNIEAATKFNSAVEDFLAGH